jgi:hypothetical protein
MFLEPVQVLRPEGPSSAYPFVQLIECLWLESIEPPLPVTACSHDPCLPQHSQVSRDGRPTYREGVGDIASRKLTRGHELHAA